MKFFLFKNPMHILTYISRLNSDDNITDYDNYIKDAVVNRHNRCYYRDLV